MWILPKQLHTSAFVPDTAALISDLAEQSQICEQSLFQRSKPSLARTWSQKWRRDSWTQLLSGRILKPSHGKSFVTKWTSSLEVILASHSPQQGSDSDETTLDTSGLGSQMELELCDPESASLRTSRDTSALDSEKSSANWKALVTKRRGEYSLRVKLAHLTSASGSSSWPTISVNESKNSVGKSQLDRNSIPLGTMVQMHGLPAPANPSTHGSRQGLSEENWVTPRTSGTSTRPNKTTPRQGLTLIEQARANEWHTPTVAEEKNQGTSSQIYLQNQVGATVKQWATPNTMDHLDCRSAEGVIKIATGARKGRSMPSNLREQVDPQTVDIYQKTKEESWATPKASDPQHAGPNMRDSAGNYALPAQAVREQWATPRLGGEEKAETRLARGKDIGLHVQVGAMTNSAKLNPRWVETLMGLPIGWVMPSCSSPLTIAPTNCDCLATESSQPPQPELF